MKYTTTLDNDNTKLGLPQSIPTLDELQYMEYDSQNFQELGMIIDNMEVHSEDF
jgi:hypothetical protein